MPKLMRFLSLSLQFILILVVGGIVGIWLAGKYGYIQPIKPYVVLSGSMEPSIKTGSVVIVSPKVFGYAPGDVITFGKSKNNTTTHRVVSLTDETGNLAYQTKGDANDNQDAAIVPKTDVVGSVMFTVPYIGYAADFAKKPQGFILLVIVPATIIVYEELRFLHAELKKLLRKPKPTKQKQVTPVVTQTPQVQPKPIMVQPAPPTRSYLGQAPIPPRGHPLERLFQLLPPASRPAYAQTPQAVPSKITSASRTTGDLKRRWLIVPAIAVTTLFVGLSGSYFLDTETSVGNILGAASSFANPEVTPTPTLPQPPLLVETLNLDAAQPLGVTSTTSLTLGQFYRLEITGTWTNRGGTDTVDADYTSYDAFATPGLDGDPAWTVFGLTDYWNLLDVQVNSAFVNWGAYTPSHQYTYDLAGTGSPVTLLVFDGIPETNTPNPGWYTDNSGSLTVNLYQLP